MPSSTLKTAGAMFRRLSQDLVGAIRRAEDKSAAKGLQIAKDFSSGTKSLAQLRREDHPFAKRHGRPLDPPEVINSQTGEFRAAWKVIAQTVKGMPVPAIVNQNWKANFLKGGTKYMFNRPVDESVGKVLEPIRIENLKRETKKLEAK
jgi:hypothetical protein